VTEASHRVSENLQTQSSTLEAPYLRLKDDVEALSASTRVDAHGAGIPVLGFGTWQLEGQVAVDQVGDALDVGYRHVDTAQAYGNEAEVGRALEASSVGREEVFVTTKVWPDHFAAGKFLDSVKSSLEKLRLGSVDLLLLHWPKFDGTDLESTLGRLNEAHERGLARHIGVSNFPTRELARAWQASDAPLTVNQVEYHPFLDQSAVLDAVHHHAMALTAYSPIARGEVDGSDRLEEIGRRHGKSAEQIALRWLIQQRAVNAIPKTSDAEHCRENFRIFDFSLSSAEMEEIAGLARPNGRLISPDDLAPEWD